MKMAAKLDLAEKKRRQDARDRVRLAKFTSAYQFQSGAHVERFAFEMYVRGLLQRENQIYRISAGARSMEYRWAYRLSAKGRKFLEGSDQEARPE